MIMFYLIAGILILQTRTLKKQKLIFINTHPIQYFAPLYKKIELESKYDLEVWYCSKHGIEGEIDKEFNTSVKWDIPILEGYKYKFLKNNSWSPGLYKGFFGLINLNIYRELKNLPKKSIVIIHGWQPFSILFAIFCSSILGHLTWLRAETPLKHELAKNKFYLFLRKLIFQYFIFRLINKFLYIGKQNKAFYKYYGVKDCQLLFTPYAVNNTYFQKKKQLYFIYKNELKSELKIPDNKKIIIYCGKLIPKKRPIDLLSAFLKLSNFLNNVLIFVGEGELSEKLESIIYLKGIQNVIITGFINQSQISKYYAIADIFVMCSDYGETWGLSTNEAMNFELPVIIADNTGNSEDLVDGNGYVFKTADIEDLTFKIDKILNSSQDEIIQMKKRSLEIVNNYSYEKIIDSITSSLEA
jgi:glycosyltransferase involved in cell wall biosynthesis